MGRHSSGSQLGRVQIGWKSLEKVINEIRDKINANMPVSGSGIHIEDLGNGGKLISLSPPPTTSSDSQKQAGPTEGKWMTVTIVDPSTCAQSQIQVWTRPVPQ